MNASNAVEARAIHKRFGSGEHAVAALDNVSVEIRKGEFFTLLGPSGCGKTTLLRLIAGFEAPTEGHILLNGRDITDQPPNRRPINTVFQSYALFPHLSVRENVAFGLNMQRRLRSEVAETVEKMLALVQLERMAERKPGQLSGGQQQRVALARALAPAPELLLLDEPLSALDLKLRKEMRSELKRLQSEIGITFIFVTHDQEEALTMSDRIAVMSAGHLLQVGTPREIYTRPVNRFVADFIGETNFISATIRGGAAELAGGGRIDIGSAGRSGPVTLAVRPEHLTLVGPDRPEAIPCTVDRWVYFGTDSHVHLRLGDGAEVVARQPAGPDDNLLPPGSAAGLLVAPRAVQVLED